MIKVEVLPDELVPFHASRTLHVYGVDSLAELSATTGAEPLAGGAGRKHVPHLLTLAAIAGVEPEAYAREHSMMAMFRVASKRGDDKPHGSAAGFGYARRFGLEVHRAGGFCCAACIAEDLAQANESWFRRSHHLAGVDWCPRHRCALARVDAPRPFSSAPHVWRDEGRLVSLDPCVAELPTDGFLRRYVDVAIALLQRAQPFDCVALNTVISYRAKALRLRVSKSGQRPLISDRVVELAPRDWLAELLPESSAKVVGHPFMQIDRVGAQRTSPATGNCYALALAALFPDTSDCRAALERAAAMGNSEAPRAFPVIRGADFWHGAVWKPYVRAKGNIKLLSEQLGIEKSYLGEALARAGLPSLYATGSPKWKAFRRFLSGESLNDACEAEGVAVEETESLLRLASARVEAALNEIEQSAGIGKRSKRARRRDGASRLDRPCRKQRAPRPEESDPIRVAAE